MAATKPLAKADLCVSPEELDTDPILLNVENGTVDLRTGSLRPHLPEDLITKLAPVEFDPVAEAPRFYKFLKQVLGEDELIRFVQRFLGYSLTGSVKERVMAVLHGVGKNGKSTLVELFLDLLGDYAASTTPEVLMRQKFGGASVEYHLAELAGVRFLAMAETKRGAELEESVVKQITGGDTISARSPYGRPFTYRPQFTIWMSTNHKPEIPDGSEAIWDRMRLIPFNQRFEGTKADAHLPAKLREELKGVLAWAVRGCVEWGGGGLGSSAAVERATAAYRAETDVYERFFADACVFGPAVRAGKKALFRAWEEWCDAEGEEPGKQVQFSRDMKEKGVVKNFEEKKIKGEWYWKGIGVLEEGGGEKFTEPVEISPPPSENGSEAPENTSETNLPPAQKSCKHGGGESSGGKVSENSKNFSENRTRVGGLLKIDENLPPEAKPSPRATPPPFGGPGTKWSGSTFR